MKTVQFNWNGKPGEIITFDTYPQTAEGTDVTPVNSILRDYCYHECDD